MKFVNLLPHAANLVTPDGAEFVIPPSGSVARCAVHSTHEEVEGVRFARTTYGEASGVPDPQPDRAAILAHAAKLSPAKRARYLASKGVA